MMRLYGYYRSSAAYRVRIALNLKQISYERIPVDLLAGEQKDSAYTTINPQQLVPALVTEHGDTLHQSLAICEYLDELVPEPRLLPVSALQRAQCRALANLVACDIHPIANLRVQQYLRSEFQVAEDGKVKWIQHWIKLGLDAYEKHLTQLQTGVFSLGDQPTLADVFLLPQVYNAKRFEVELDSYSRLNTVVEACSAIMAFAKAHPDHHEILGKE